MDREDATKLWMLLQTHELLLKYPHYKHIRRMVESALAKINNTNLGPLDVIDDPSVQRPAPPIYPRDGGVGQEGDSEPKSIIRRA